LRRLFHDRFAAPFAREVAAVAERPFFGPRERHRLEVIIEALEHKQQDLASHLLALAPGGSPQDLSTATEQALNAVGEALLGEADAAGVPLLFLEGNEEIQFHATLLMPLPIVRANTCTSGDSAEWTFTEDDLFGRGFEMKALAAER
jgi:hypothetical protein